MGSELRLLASQAEEPVICANTVNLMTLTETSSSLQESWEEWVSIIELWMFKPWSIYFKKEKDIVIPRSREYGKQKCILSLH